MTRGVARADLRAFLHAPGTEAPGSGSRSCSASSRSTAAASRVESDARLAAPSSASSSRPRGLGMKRLLVVDDDAACAAVLQILAHKMGLDCAAASGADEALASFRAERSDVVVTDLKMPGKSGIEFLARAPRDRRARCR